MKKRSVTNFALLAFAGVSLFATGVVADIPKPGDVTVTRENYHRIVTILSNAGLSRTEIQRWINASQNAPDRPGSIPNPTQVAVNRDNYNRIVNALAGMGLNRDEINRWVQASLQAQNNGSEGRQAERVSAIAGVNEHGQQLATDQSRVRTQDQSRRAMSDRVADRANDRSARPDRATDQRQVRVRPIRATRVQRPVRVQRPQRPNRPLRPQRPSRPGG